MSRRVLLLLLAGGIVIFTVLLIRSRLTEPPAVTALPVQATRVVIAKRDLVVGSFVQGLQDLDWGTLPDVLPPAPAPDANAPADAAPPAAPLPLPASVTKENYLYEGSVKLTDFNGAVVRRSLHAGDPVPQFAIMKAGEGGFMSAVLEPGMRAVSIGVNATSGNAGFVSPGDRIDLIVTHRVKIPQPAGVTNTNDEFVASETFVRDVRVVAVDQMLDNPDNKAILAKTITVEVNPRQAEEVAVAADLGKISIALRSLSSPNGKPVTRLDGVRTPLEAGVQMEDMVNGTGVTRDSDISALLLNRKTVTTPRVHVIHGDKIENMDFDQEPK